MLLILIGVAAGAIVPVQTIANTRLSRVSGTALSASLISFSIGSIALALTALATGNLPHPHALGETPWWTLTGGALGVIALTGNILLYPKLGAVKTVILPVSGQIVAGFGIDALGLFNAPTLPPNFLQIFGGAMVLAGVAACVRRAPDPHSGAAHWPLYLAGIGCGMCLAAQSAINGQLGMHLGSPISAALISFLVGTATLAVVNLGLQWRPKLWITGQNQPWWIWIGGICGASLVSANALLAPRLGTGVTVVVTLCGMMAASVAVDRLRGVAVTGVQAVGLGAVVCGVALSHLS